jgi:hypothetical protein
MKPIKIISDTLVPKGYSGITLFPFIILRKKTIKKISDDKLQRLINHETTHFYQQLGLLIIPFYLIYIINYIINLFIYKNHHDAYKNIVFEREAYNNEINPIFGFYRWIKYFSKK